MKCICLLVQAWAPSKTSSSAKAVEAVCPIQLFTFQSFWLAGAWDGVDRRRMAGLLQVQGSFGCSFQFVGLSSDDSSLSARPIGPSQAGLQALVIGNWTSFLWAAVHRG